MACSTCDHTMQALAVGWFWCPRCGTVRNEKFGDHDADVPKVVTTVRAYLRHMPELEVQRRHLDKTLEEQVLLPANRNR